MYLLFIYLCTCLFISLLRVILHVCGTLSIIHHQCVLYYLNKDILFVVQGLGRQLHVSWLVEEAS
jgi:hypothetical protein